MSCLTLLYFALVGTIYAEKLLCTKDGVVSNVFTLQGSFSRRESQEPYLFKAEEGKRTFRLVKDITWDGTYPGVIDGIFDRQDGYSHSIKSARRPVYLGIPRPLTMRSMRWIDTNDTLAIGNTSSDNLMIPLFTTIINVGSDEYVCFRRQNNETLKGGTLMKEMKNLTAKGRNGWILVQKLLEGYMNETQERRKRRGVEDQEATDDWGFSKHKGRDKDCGNQNNWFEKIYKYGHDIGAGGTELTCKWFNTKFGHCFAYYDRACSKGGKTRDMFEENEEGYVSAECMKIVGIQTTVKVVCGDLLVEATMIKNDKELLELIKENTNISEGVQDEIELIETQVKGINEYMNEQVEDLHSFVSDLKDYNANVTLLIESAAKSRKFTRKILSQMEIQIVNLEKDVLALNRRLKIEGLTGNIAGKTLREDVEEELFKLTADTLDQLHALRQVVMPKDLLNDFEARSPNFTTLDELKNHSRIQLDTMRNNTEKFGLNLDEQAKANEAAQNKKHHIAAIGIDDLRTGIGASMDGKIGMGIGGSAMILLLVGLCLVCCVMKR